MITKQEIEEKCREIIRIQLGKESFDSSTNLINDLCADSLDMVEICMECESAFMIALSDEDWEKVVTFQNLIDLCYDTINNNNNS